MRQTTPQLTSREVNVFPKSIIRAGRQPLVWIALLALLVVVIYQLWAVAENMIAGTNEAKKGRTTTAIVKRKEYVRFDEKNHSYIGSFGQSVEAAPGTEQWRIYYE